jgi:hypothetical protein
MMNNQAQSDPMEFNPQTFLRIGYYSQELGPIYWSPEDWERPFIQCVNDLVHTPQGAARVTSVQNGIETEIVRRLS